MLRHIYANPLRRGTSLSRGLLRKSTQRPITTTLQKQCGVIAFFQDDGSPPEEQHIRLLMDRMEMRGPDGQKVLHGVAPSWGWALGHQRLAIMDPHPSGDQPMRCSAGNLGLVANGEIYNYKDLYDEHVPADTERASGSDCEVILHLYRQMGKELVSKLDGMFAFVLVDPEQNTFLAARDPHGKKPLYMGVTSTGGRAFASELKCLVDQGFDEISEIPAGCQFTPEAGVEKYYNPAWDNDDYVHDPSITPEQVRESLEAAVVKRMMSDVDYGVFLSGGVDSCIVATLMRPHIQADSGFRLPSITVGMEDSPDVMASRAIAEHLGFDHSERIFTAQEACDVVDKVIYHLETYEPELIRSAIPNYFLAQHTYEQGVKMVMTGEGADELFAGYVYFEDAPNPTALQNELRRIFHALYNVNLKRTDRMTMAWGVEARVPFLDIEFVRLAMSIPPAQKMITDRKYNREKAYLRKMFTGEIPEEVLWRQKAMQCEGVGEGWVSILQQHCASRVSDQQFAYAREKFKINPPVTKEEAYYRLIFDSHFPDQDRFVHVWEGGCRAGGAAWESAAYTREGLADVSRLSHGLQSAVEPRFSASTAVGAGRAMSTHAAGNLSPLRRGFRTWTPPNSSFCKNKNLSSAPPQTAAPKRVSASLDLDSMILSNMMADARATDFHAEQDALIRSTMLVSGADWRTKLDPLTGVNSYYCGPFPKPKGSIVRSSCTASTLTPLIAEHFTPDLVLDFMRNPRFSAKMESVRKRLAAALDLPAGTGIITAPSGTDLELLPLAIAKTLNPDAATVHSVITGLRETGRGCTKAAAGEYFSPDDTPLGEPSDLLPPDMAGGVTPYYVDARVLADGSVNDASCTIAAALAAAEPAGEPVLTHVIYGTKTNMREAYPAPHMAEASARDGANYMTVVDACQGRLTNAELAEMLRRNDMVLLTGSKFYQGPSFCGALLVPPQTMARLRAAPACDTHCPAMLGRFFTRDDVPNELEHWRAQLPPLQNRGLALRWEGALVEMEAWADAATDEEKSAAVASWRAKHLAQIAATRRVHCWEANDTIINVSISRADGTKLGVEALKKVYKWAAENISGVRGIGFDDEQALAATSCLIGQPVDVHANFGIVRFALGASDVRRLLVDPTALDVEDATMLRKLDLIAQNFESLERLL